MPLFIAALNSGSNGNAYYVGNGEEAILVDAGISCRETERRMHRLGLAVSAIRAIFISHEHSDHITGLAGLSKKYSLPVYMSAATHKSCSVPVQQELVRYFEPMETVSVGGMAVRTFPKRHDASDPHSFVVSSSGINVGVFTDIGSCCQHVTAHFKSCHAVFLESNYCETMLEQGRYPYYLKKRIRGESGHLSNDQALELFKSFRGPQLSHLILSHLSKNNNCPQLVQRMFSAHAGNTDITVASRYEETPVFQVTGIPAMLPSMAVPKRMPPRMQLSLFD